MTTDISGTSRRLDTSSDLESGAIDPRNVSPQTRLQDINSAATRRLAERNTCSATDIALVTVLGITGLAAVGATTPAFYTFLGPDNNN